MKELFIILLMMLTFRIYSQKLNPRYDSLLAKELGGNVNGMRKYVLAILKTGSYDQQSKQIRDSLFAGHMKNIESLADNGSLAVAGPLGKNDKNYRGIFILNVETIEEAKTLLLTDPAVNAKIFDFEMFFLWCTAGLQEISKIHNKIQKFSD